MTTTPGMRAELPFVYEESHWHPERPATRFRYFLARFLNDRGFAALRYWQVFRRLPRLDPPLTYNEKILWRMLHDRNPLFPRLTDKLAVRDYVVERGSGDLLKHLHGVFDAAEELPFERLPERFVVKPNHGSGWLSFVSNKNAVTRSDLERICRWWFQWNYYDRAREWAYREISPHLMVEELLEHDEDYGEDYKLYCFDGEPRYLHVDRDRFTNRPTTNFYVIPWKPLPVRDLFELGRAMPEPPAFEEMLHHARALSQELDFVRVDLTLFQGSIYFGEMTVYPHAGMGRFTPDSFDLEMGSHWSLPQPSVAG